MKITGKDLYRLRDKIDLILEFNYYSIVFTFLFGLVCVFLLNVKGIIPYTFFSFASLNLVNTLLYRYHKNLILAYNITSIIAMIGSTIVTLSSGGIQSSFVFVLAIIVFSGYVSARVYGQLYLVVNLSILTLLFLYDVGAFGPFKNTVPVASQSWFAFLSVVFAVYLLGGVLGKNLLRAHHNLYRSRYEIQKRILEKENLLKEVHHRVKNNLQTVSSLLSLQSRSTNDKKVSNIIKSSQNRIVSMAMVHEMLYKREDYLSKIELKPYINELCDYLLRSIGSNTSKVKIHINIPEEQLSIDTVIPLGLIINETITNTLKYGIVKQQEGEIYIALRKLSAIRYEMYLGDNGVGYPEEINSKTSRSLGLKLIHNLARQLKGTVIREKEKKGTHYRIEFEEIMNTSSSEKQGKP